MTDRACKIYGCRESALQRWLCQKHLTDHNEQQNTAG